jgi:C4-dicarboxylate-specific signal transduction histidine kinase
MNSAKLERAFSSSDLFHYRVLVLTQLRSNSKQLLLDAFDRDILQDRGASAQLDQHVANSRQLLEELEANFIGSSEIKQRIASLRSLLDKMYVRFQLQSKTTNSWNRERMVQFETGNRELATQYQEELAKIYAYASETEEKSIADTKKVARRLTFEFPMWTLLFCLGFAMFLIPLTIRAAQKFRRIESFLDSIDLSSQGEWQLDMRGHDEFAGIANAFNRLFSRLRQTEKELDKKQQELVVQEKMASLGQMAGGVAHEINSPLATIAIKVEQLEEMLKEDTLDKKLALEWMRTVRETSQRIAKIVEGLRTFSRDGSSDPMAVAKLQDIVDQTLILCAEKMRHHGVEIRISGFTEDLSIMCRATQISQVLLSFLNNSFEAIGSLSEKWIEISARAQDPWVELTVTDSGSGISSEISEKIFDPFFTTKEVGKGTGLGLSVSKSVLEGHGGSICLDKKSDHTRFVILFPRSP